MKLMMTMLFLISSVAMATTAIDLDSKEVSLANFGDITKTADFDLDSINRCTPHRFLETK